MPIKYIGRSIDYKGKTLWEIVGNLKNFGVGRIIARSMLERYPEPSYIKICKVETVANPEFPTPDDVRKVKVWVEKVFRGRKYPNLIPIFGASYKADYVLIPKDKEKEYCMTDNPAVYDKVLPKTTSFPPLLKELIIKERKARGEDVTEEPQMPLIYCRGRDSYYRQANDNEKPSVEFQPGLETPIAKSLYKNVKI